MIEVIPVMLFILGWHPDRSGEIDFERPETLFLSVAQCEETGGQIAARMTAAAADNSGAQYMHRCLPVPSYSEYDAVFAQPARKGQ